ncbi:acyltransferase (plasmid) [Pseudobutyrivibrio xylanivorans]|uniref:Acyltransferase n=1 Tax=Pseudobutyrivibrio xylanivorans TaxID=185007 RepID=A0A5P6VW97_PSEXY|nr:acyltransferase [Pseudobutyrivibrio xylanivorans]
MLYKKIKKLIVPYICYSFIVYIVFSIANLFSRMNGILDRAGYGKITFIEWIKGLLSGENLYCQHLWYIYSLFILSIISFALLKLVGNKYKYILFMITFICWYFFSNSEYYDVVWKTSMRGIWYAAGTLMNKEFLTYRKNRVYVMICLPCLVLLKWYTEISNVKYNIEQFLDLIIILGIVLAFLTLSFYIDLNGGKRITWLGKHTFPIYIFHQPFLVLDLV